jgi:hypothetical protein
MAADDWRIQVEVTEEQHATGLVERLAGELGSEARELAKELEDRRLAVSRDGETVFVYAATRAEGEQARAIVEAELRENGIEARVGNVEHWLDEEDRWEDEPGSGTWEADELRQGYAPWEVRVECGSRQEASGLADRLEQEGYKPVRRFQYLIVGTASREEAEALAGRLHGEVELGGNVAWEEAQPFGRIFTIFGGLGT